MLVVVRAHLSGVWAGELRRKDDAEVHLCARKLFSWSGALDVSTIALHGAAGKISGMTEVTLLRSDCIEIHEMAAEAWARIQSVEVAR